MSTDLSAPTSLERAPAALVRKRLEGVPGVLGRIALERQADYAHAELPRSLESSQVPGFAAALRGTGLSLIAEIKRSSPSQGAIAALEPATAATAYARGGASALSVLTEPRHFGGDLSHIGQARRAVDLPVLRKDFTVHPLQLVEARKAGASAVLLIVALTGEATADYVRFAASMGLDALVEVHDEGELEIALAANPALIGVNNRDLRTLEIDLSTAPRLLSIARRAGFEGVLVAESGYRSPDDLQPLAELADAVLVGTSLAGSGDLENAVRRLLQR